MTSSTADLTAKALANATRESAHTKPRRHRRLLIGLILFSGGLVMAGTGYWLDLPGRVFGSETHTGTLYQVKPVTLNVTLKEDGELKPLNSVEIKCEVQGQNVTIEWIIDESTHVEAGDLLVRLASDDIKERVEMEQMEVDRIAAALVEARQELEITRSENASLISKSEVDLRIAELELQRYLHGDYEKTKKQIEINIANTEMNIHQTQDELDKSRPLVEKGFVTRSKIDELVSSLEQLHMTLDKHNLELAILEQYELTKSRMQKSAAVDQARQELERERQRATSRERQAEEKVNNQDKTLALRQSRLERLKDQLAKCEIHTPNAGVVQYGESGGRGWRRGNPIAPGEQVYPGQNAGHHSRHLADDGHHAHPRSRPPPDRRTDCPASCAFRPSRAALSPVRCPRSPQFADSERSWWNPELKEHATEILLKPTDAPLSPGDSAQVEILIDEIPDVLARTGAVHLLPRTKTVRLRQGTNRVRARADRGRAHHRHHGRGYRGARSGRRSAHAR